MSEEEVDIVKEFEKFCEDLYCLVDDDMGGHFKQVIGNQVANTNLGYLIFKEKLEKQDKELEVYKRIARKKLDDREEIIKNLCSHRCFVKSHYEAELETYKKIAEIFAQRLIDIDYGCEYIPTEICNEYNNGRCLKCLIEWEKGVITNDK